VQLQSSETEYKLPNKKLKEEKEKYHPRCSCHGRKKSEKMVLLCLVLFVKKATNFHTSQ
jgi:hypothetical protein